MSKELIPDDTLLTAGPSEGRALAIEVATVAAANDHWRHGRQGESTR